MPKGSKYSQAVDTVINLASFANPQSTNRNPHKLVDSFTYHSAYGYDKKRVIQFLRRTCTAHTGLDLTEKEKMDLQALWKEILEPYL